MQIILDEQGRPGPLRRMSAIQWDMYTGSGSYREILLRSLHPTLLMGLARGVWAALRVERRRQPDAPVAPVAQPSIFP
jgi:hypothetical protein